MPVILAERDKSPTGHGHLTGFQLSCQPSQHEARTVLFQFWANVADGGPELKQHSVGACGLRDN